MGAKHSQENVSVPQTTQAPPFWLLREIDPSILVRSLHELLAIPSDVGHLIDGYLPRVGTDSFQVPWADWSKTLASIVLPNAVGVWEINQSAQDGSQQLQTLLKSICATEIELLGQIHTTSAKFTVSNLVERVFWQRRVPPSWHHAKIRGAQKITDLVGRFSAKHGGLFFLYRDVLPFEFTSYPRDHHKSKSIRVASNLADLVRFGMSPSEFHDLVHAEPLHSLEEVQPRRNWRCGVLAPHCLAGKSQAQSMLLLPAITKRPFFRLDEAHCAGRDVVTVMDVGKRRIWGGRPLQSNQAVVMFPKCQ